LSYKNLESQRKWSRAYRAKHKKKVNALARVRGERMRAAGRWSVQKLHEKVFDLLGRKCRRCGFEDARALQIDHVGGNGAEERRIYTSPTKFYKHVLEVEGVGYQILCANCNAIKRIENKEHPKVRV